MNIWKPGIHGNEGKTLYRAEISRYGHIDEFENYSGTSYQIHFHEYLIIKETHETFVLIPMRDKWMLDTPLDCFRKALKTKRIYKVARNKWVYPTKEEALRSLYWRKRAYKTHAKRRADEAVSMFALVGRECEDQKIDLFADMKKETRYE